jgi:ComF family protein
MRDFLGGLFFGGACYACRGRARAVLCDACRAELPRLGAELCPSCALPSPAAALCGRCLAEPPDYDATVAVLAYDFPADALLHALKFRGELSLAPFLAGLMKEQLGSHERIDRVIPVPLSAARLRERGYNQAVELARHLLPGKMDFSSCVRERDAVPQMELPWAERQRNVRGAFGCKRGLAGASVAVVDDVMTTGATLAEMARTLKRAGAARVVNWVVARTLPPR